MGWKGLEETWGKKEKKKKATFLNSEVRSGCAAGNDSVCC